MTEPATDVSVLAVMALEWMADADPRAALSQADTGLLAERIGHDLSLLVPEVASLDLVVMGAHFDPAEVLRPGWPVHRRLHELQQRAPGRNAGPRILAFGTDAEGNIPQPLQADDALRGGGLRVLPWLLHGEGATAVGARLEEILVDRGMARAETALFAQDTFGARIEHARYLTVHDLAAMMAMQYDHQGLAPLWNLVEAALLAPDAVEWLDAGAEPLLRLEHGEVRMALFDPAGWCVHYRHGQGDCDRLQRVYDHFMARQRQFAAVLEAHGIPVLFVHCDGQDDARALLAA